MSHTQTVLPLGGRLTPDAVRRLGAMAGTSKPAVEAAIAVAPFSFRVQLFSQIPPLIAVEPTEADALKGRPTKIELTRHGQDAIQECAEWMRQHHGSTKVLTEAMYC
jgi:hypothetical protein